MTDNVFWIIKMTINEGKLDDFKALAAEMCEGTKAEAGAISYEWFLLDDSTCHIHERYANSGAVMEHLGNFGAKYAERFMSMVTPTGFDVYGPADDNVRGALADMGAAHYAQFAGFDR